MTRIDFAPRATSQVVDHYVDTRIATDRPISTAHALRAIRTALPNCLLSDRELSDMVAASAIKKGRVVSFDGDADVREKRA